MNFLECEDINLEDIEKGSVFYKNFYSIYIEDVVKKESASLLLQLWVSLLFGVLNGLLFKNIIIGIVTFIISGICIFIYSQYYVLLKMNESFIKHQNSKEMKRLRVSLIDYCAKNKITKEDYINIVKFEIMLYLKILASTFIEFNQLEAYELEVISELKKPFISNINDIISNIYKANFLSNSEIEDIDKYYKILLEVIFEKKMITAIEYQALLDIILNNKYKKHMNLFF